MGRRTPLYEAHLAAGGSMVDFAGWDMPLHYGSQVAEHHAVRGAAGMFDVSHMCAVDLHGAGALALLRLVLANDVGTLDPGRGLYSVMCNESGGVVDDVIVYRLGDGFRVVVNSATTQQDLAWLDRHATGDVAMQARTDLSLIAVQGPDARRLTAKALPDLHQVTDSLRPFDAVTQGEIFVARTGYTGEDGLELAVPDHSARSVWDALLGAGVRPAGLGARDTLRLEAGLNLYGSDMDQQTSPLESGLGWTVAWQPSERDFIGRSALQAMRSAVPSRRVGLLLQARGVMRAGQPVRTDDGEGVVTSGSFSPTMGRSIALARVPTGTATTAVVEIRGRSLDADIVAPPFVRNGQPRYPSGEGASA